MSLIIIIDGVRVDIEVITPPEDDTYRDAWEFVNGEIIVNMGKAHDIAVSRVSVSINNKMLDVIKVGVLWRNLNTDSFNSISLSNDMRLFLSDMHSAMNPVTGARSNEHGGAIFQNGKEFSINDEGIVELAKFANSWGRKISRISNNLIKTLDAMTVNDLESFDVELIDFTVTWDASDIAAKFLNNTLTQDKS